MCAIFGVIGINDLGLVKKMSKFKNFEDQTNKIFLMIQNSIYVLETIDFL